MTFTKAIIIFALLVISFNLLIFGAYRRTVAEAKRREAEEDNMPENDKEEGADDV